MLTDSRGGPKIEDPHLLNVTLFQIGLVQSKSVGYFEFEEIAKPVHSKTGRIFIMIEGDDITTIGVSKALRDWLTKRDNALHLRSRLRADGGHIILRNDVYDPESLEEPLRSEALAFLKEGHNQPK